jgi:hypothetical protein
MSVDGLIALRAASPAVLDCEMIGGTFWVFDLLMLAGEDLRLAAPLHRRQLLESSWDGLWGGLRTKRRLPLLSLKPVTLQQHLVFTELREEMGRMPCDGLIIQEAWDPLSPVLKFKEDVTVDLQLDSEGRGCARESSSAVVPWVEASSLRLPEGTQYPAGAVVECSWDPSAKIWKVERLRLDRAGPNSLAICEESHVIAQNGWNTWSWMTEALSADFSKTVLREAWIDACVWEMLRRASAILGRMQPIKLALVGQTRTAQVAERTGLFALDGGEAPDLIAFVEIVDQERLQKISAESLTAFCFLYRGTGLEFPARRRAVAIQLPQSPEGPKELALKAALIV